MKLYDIIVKKRENRQDVDVALNEYKEFLVDRQGNVVKRFDPTVKPEQLEACVEQLLSK